jgi:hypothetical protein
LVVIITATAKKEENFLLVPTKNHVLGLRFLYCLQHRNTSTKEFLISALTEIQNTGLEEEESRQKGKTMTTRQERPFY